MKLLICDFVSCIATTKFSCIFVLAVKLHFVPLISERWKVIMTRLVDVRLQLSV